MAYQYEPLADDGMIRLLQLEPCHNWHSSIDHSRYQPWLRLYDRETTKKIVDAKNNKDCKELRISCKIKHVSIADHPVYETLSYTWGKPVPEFQISCDGQPFKISTNLYGALHSLRHRQEPALLWVDAICINQEDLLERNSQVSMMRQIYENAQSTHIWLGEATEESALGFEFMPKLLRGAELQISADDTRSVTEMSIAGFQDYYGEGTSRFDAEGFLALSLLPWFRRVWIIQEVSVSKSATLVCGSDNVDWDDFVRTVTFCIQFQFAGAFDISLQRIERMALSRREIRENQGKSLEQLLFRYRDFNSTDPRDKVYSLLGLVDNADVMKLSLKIDYGVSALILYRHVAIEFLRTYRSLDILSACRATSTTDLPSWVPDWRVSDVRLPLLLHGFQQQSYVNWTATRNSVYNLELTADDERLLLRGHILARIKEVGAVSPLPRDDEVMLPNTARMYRLALKCYAIENWVRRVSWGLLQDHKYFNGEELSDALWQTAVAGYYGPEDYDMCKRNFDSGFIGDKFFIFKLWMPRLFYWLYSLLTIIPMTIYFIVRIIQRGGALNGDIAHVNDFVTKAIHINSGGWAVSTTVEGYLALTPGEARAGDHIGLFEGGKTPFILRKSGECWRLIGECYVHGIMHGEKFEEDKCEAFEIC